MCKALWKIRTRVVREVVAQLGRDMNLPPAVIDNAKRIALEELARHRSGAWAINWATRWMERQQLARA